MSESWDERYSAEARVWSGRPNHWLVECASGLAPGSAADLGCGEGADAIWLAQRGWDVTGVDFSRVGLARARAAAQEAGVSVDWVFADLETWQPERQFDLVSVQYFHAPPAVRGEVHRLAWRATRSTLLIVGHDVDHPGGPPVDRKYGAASVLDALGLQRDPGHVVVAESRRRGDAHDSIVVVRR